MKDNRGFSLIEMIAVMAVLAILITVSLSAFGLNDSGYVKDNTKGIESMIEKAYFNTQAKAAKYWMVKINNSDGIYTMELYKVKDDDTAEKVEEQVLKPSELKLSSLFVTSTALDDVDIDSMSVYFEKQTGEVAKLEVNGVSYNAADLKGQMGTLKIQRNQKIKNVEIYWSTGKVFAEN